MLQSMSKWLASTSLSWAMAGGVPWLWPLCETLHFIGLALLLGVVGLLDLRMLGFGKDIPLGPLQRLTPWGILGFVINLVTGMLFFVGAPSQYVTNVAFLFKMAVYRTGRRECDSLLRDRSVPARRLSPRWR